MSGELPYSARNMKLWHAARGAQGDTLMERATSVFGPAGYGWGWRVRALTEGLPPISVLTLWWTFEIEEEEVRGEIEVAFAHSAAIDELELVLVDVFGFIDPDLVEVKA